MDAVGLRRIVLHQVLARIVRIVGQHRGIPEKKRLLVGAAAAHEVVGRLHRGAADREAIVAMPAPLGHAFAEAAVRKMSLPPLAGLEAGIAVRGEQRGQERPLGEVAIHRVAAGDKQFLALRRVAAHARLLGRIIADDPVLVWIATGDDRGETRAAEARRHVAMWEHQTLAGEPVERGRPQVGVTQEGIVPPVLVVGDDEDDIRRHAVCRGRRGRGT